MKLVPEVLPAVPSYSLYANLLVHTLVELCRLSWSAEFVQFERALIDFHIIVADGDVGGVEKTTSCEVE